jgi:hypothetical protein
LSHFSNQTFVFIKATGDSQQDNVGEC